MRKISLIPILPQILSSNRKWFSSKGKDGIFPDLSEEDLQEGNFSNCNLVEANLQAANLSCSDFTDADLRGENLLETNFKGAILNNANFEGTDLI
jgi:hypothetical protein